MLVFMLGVAFGVEMGILRFAVRFVGMALI